MTRAQAKAIAEKITPEQLKQMFDNVVRNFSDWEKPSAVNIGLTKGTAFNVLSHGFGKDFDPKKQIHILAKTNMVREFWEFLPAELITPKEPKKQQPKPSHQTPDLSDWF